MNDVLTLPSPIDLSDRARPIVMVEDEELDYLTVERSHRRARIANPLLRFPEGESFLAHLERIKRGEAPWPALVLMDVNLPGMNGFEVIEAMRRDERFRTVPVAAMLTSSSDERDRERAATFGADAYLVKPFDPRVYVAFFESLAA